MVTVTTTAGAEQIDGADFGIGDGILIVVDGQGNNVAGYAAGVWQSVAVTSS